MKTLLLIDANALVHRAYHALPSFTARDGRPTGAIFGLASILIKIFKENPPDYIVAAFDRPEPNFRDALLSTYKAHRPEPDNELVLQIVESYNLFKSFGIRTIDAPGFEGDDIIGSLVYRFKPEKDLQIIIFTGDLDSLQLVDSEKVLSRVIRKGITDTVMYDEAAVIARYGLRPTQLPDYKGLVGDVSDNIPKVMGVGPKTALLFLQKYGSLDNFFEKASKIKMDSEKDADLIEKIINHKDQILLSKKLATIRTDAPLGIDSLQILATDPNYISGASEYLSQFGFRSLIKRMQGGDEGEKVTKPKKNKVPQGPKQGNLL